MQGSTCILAGCIFHADFSCHTPVGYIARKSAVTIGRGCERKGTVMHELLHALGFWHEQSRTDRDNYVTIHFDNIQSGTISKTHKILDWPSHRTYPLRSSYLLSWHHERFLTKNNITVTFPYKSFPRFAPNIYYCINTSATRYYRACINENKSRVLIREFDCARAVNIRLLFLLVTRHHAKHVGNYKCPTSARVMHIFSRRKKR